MTNKQLLVRMAPAALAVLLAACGSPASTGDTQAPVVHLTSAATTSTANYELSGVVFDNVGVVSVSYSLAGAEPEALTPDADAFSVALTLPAGDTEITVTATDAAGNSGSDSITVNYIDNSVEPPGSMTPDADIAARGDSVTLTGSGFGAPGSVHVGGAEATVGDWSDTEISFTVPLDAPAGPQEIVVETAGGSATAALFVGVDFESGTLDELAALNLPAGTAVRLGAGTFTQSAPIVTLNSLSLYGNGAGETILDTGNFPKALVVTAADGQDLVVADLELHTDAFLISTPSLAPAAVGPATFTGLASAAMEFAAESLNAQSAFVGSVTLRDLEVEDNAGGLGVITLDPYAQIGYAGTVNVENVACDCGRSYLLLLLAGDVNITGSEFDVVDHSLVSTGGNITVVDSMIEASGYVSPLDPGLTGVFASGAITITDSTLETYTTGQYNLGPLELMLAVAGSGSLPPALPIGGSLEINGSTIRSMDNDPAAATGAGTLLLAYGGGESHITDSVIVAHRLVGIGGLGGSAVLSGNEFQVGAPGIGEAPLAILHLRPSRTEFNENLVDWQEGGALTLQSTYNASLKNNEFNGNSGVAVRVVELVTEVSSQSVELVGNTFTGYESALQILLDGASGMTTTFTATGNNFDFPIDGPGDVAVLADVVNATIDIDGNRWGGETDVALLNSFITRSGSTPPDMMEITNVVP